MVSSLTCELKEVFKSFRYVFKTYLFLIPNLFEWWAEAMVCHRLTESC